MANNKKSSNIYCSRRTPFPISQNINVAVWIESETHNVQLSNQHEAAHVLQWKLKRINIGKPKLSLDDCF